MSLYVYQIGPIDYFGESWGWTDMKRLLNEAIDDNRDIDSGLSKSELTLRWRQAQELAHTIGWEGDIREGPWLAAIPVETGCWDFIIAWKQDNNGTTFVATPYRLPWLDENAPEPGVERLMEKMLMRKRNGSSKWPRQMPDELRARKHYGTRTEAEC